MSPEKENEILQRSDTLALEYWGSAVSIGAFDEKTEIGIKL